LFFFSHTRSLNFRPASLRFPLLSRFAHSTAGSERNCSHTVLMIDDLNVLNLRWLVSYCVLLIIMMFVVCLRFQHFTHCIVFLFCIAFYTLSFSTFVWFQVKTNKQSINIRYAEKCQRPGVDGQSLPAHHFTGGWLFLADVSWQHWEQSKST